MNADTAIAEMHAEQALHSAEKHLASLNEAFEWRPEDISPWSFDALDVLRMQARSHVNSLRRMLGISNGDLG